MTDRLPPQAIEEEQAVLGSLLLDKSAISKVADILTAESFYKSNHGIIWTAAMVLFARAEPIDHITLSDELEKQGKLEGVGGPAFLAELSDSVASAARVKSYAKIVQEKATLRNLITLAHEIQEKCHSNSVPAGEILDRVQSDIMSVSLESKISEPTLFSEMLPKVLDTLSQYHHQRKGVTGIPTGLVDLDEQLGGLKDTDLIVLAGRPSMGKTACAVNNIAIGATKRNIPTGLFSLEMSTESLIMRSLASHADVNFHQMVHGKLRDADWDTLSMKMSQIADIPLVLDDTSALTITSIRSRARRMVLQYGVKLIVIDFLQLVRSGDHKAESRNLEIGNITLHAKEMAKELKIPVVLVCQLSREVEKRSDKKPMLSDLRDSGEIEQNTDVALFLWRPHYYGLNHPEDYAQIIIAKNRNGPTGAVEVSWRKEQMLFGNKAKEYEIPGF